MIVHDLPGNNFIHLKKVMLTAWFIAITLFVSSCGKDSTDQTNKSTNNSVTANDLCEITVDDTAWQVFAGYAHAAASENPPTRTDFQVFADLPIISHWKESMDGNLPSIRIVNWLEATFASDEVATGVKHNKDRRRFSESFRYSVEHLVEIDSLIQKFQTGGHCCSFRDQIDFWISSDVTPDSLVIGFFPSKPEIRTMENFLFVDTGVLQAGNLNQLVRQLTGMLFRSTMALHGDSPTGTEGELAVAHSLRIMMNEGLIDYIQDQPGTIFNPVHPKLGEINIVPETVFEHGQRAISLLNFNLPKMFADEDLMQKNGRNLAKTLLASSSLRQGGYSMSSAIAGQLGEERLRDTAGSPTAWLAAYQEAAKLNPSPTPDPYEVPTELYRCMPPLDEEVYEGLQNILSNIFSTSQ